MERRRTLGSEVAEMRKEWVELLNERERAVTDLQNVEFDLATNESHSEYWMSFKIGQHTGENTVNGKLDINLNGANIGYYMLARDYSKNADYVSVHVYMQPVGMIDFAHIQNNIAFNSPPVFRNGSVGKETGTGKLTFRFAANYTGMIENVKVCAR